ncbi:NAD(P)-binding protein [Cylindrobasidium torrendii FP15055 ss-10]|uniref:NAD(P)-binding protein n=1 Tax=Cylindrobasidium torrendii FP15055 ss-10 TaxID=1314674 RepID=A0A0D7BC21_9AGAR|nr:NAD(P)-binding protein [Cylindrobasidium torrendii FP15055 ss-10]
MAGTKIFITGGTGYIGGSILSALLSPSRASQNLDITALVRSAEKKSKLEALGVRVVLGGLSDVHLIREEAGKADVIFNTANADDLEAAKAILEGMKAYKERTGKTAALIHTSGTGVLVANIPGLVQAFTALATPSADPTPITQFFGVPPSASSSPDPIYSDLDVKAIEGLPAYQPHRAVDVEIVKADVGSAAVEGGKAGEGEGYARTYIVLPSMIYGRARGVVVEKAGGNGVSDQIPGTVKAFVGRGQGGVLGEGTNVWPNVHIEDVTSLYLLIFDLLSSPSPPPEFAHGRAGFYFAENGHHAMLDVYTAIASSMASLGVGSPLSVDSAGSRIPNDEIMRILPGPQRLSVATHVRCSADRGRACGWKPTRGREDLLASVREEVEAAVKAVKEY